MLLEFANIGYQIGAAGIVAFTVSFLVVVRWWTDHLGRMLAGVLSATSGVLIMTTLRMMHPEWVQSHAYLVVRVILFWMFGLGIWTALVSFIWAQFFAPRIRGTRLVRMPIDSERKVDEEADSADSRHSRDGDSDRLSGGVSG